MREVAGWKGATRSVELLKCTLRTQGADSMAGPQPHLVGWWLRFEKCLKLWKAFSLASRAWKTYCCLSHQTAQGFLL